ncbi:hypothetical protein GCM10027269_37490 [Kribbella endophytica]
MLGSGGCGVRSTAVRGLRPPATVQCVLLGVDALLIEDGVELVVLSLITSYAYSLPGYDAAHGGEKLPGRRRFRHR